MKSYQIALRAMLKTEFIRMKLLLNSEEKFCGMEAVSEVGRRKLRQAF